MDDPFIKANLEGILHNIRTEVLLVLIAPYKHVRLEFLANHLGDGVDAGEVEDLLVGLILDGRLKGKVDQLGGTLEIDRSSETCGLREAALQRWAKALSTQMNRVLPSIC